MRTRTREHERAWAHVPIAARTAPRCRRAARLARDDPAPTLSSHRAHGHTPLDRVRYSGMRDVDAVAHRTGRGLARCAYRRRQSRRIAWVSATPHGAPEAKDRGRSTYGRPGTALGSTPAPSRIRRGCCGTAIDR